MVHGVSIAAGPYTHSPPLPPPTYTPPPPPSPVTPSKRTPPPLNHHRRHPRKHMVLLLFGRAVEGVDVTRSNALYLYMIICGLNESFGLLMDTSDRSIIPDTSWCMKYCPRYLFPLYRSAGKWSLGVFKGERPRSREMPRRTNTVINSVPSQTALCSSNANEWHNANMLPDSLWIT